MNVPAKKEIDSHSSLLDRGPAIAVELLWRDRRWLPPYLALLCLPILLSLFAPDGDIRLEAVSFILAKLASLYVCFRITLRARDLLPSAANAPGPTALSYTGLGFVLWFTWSFPILGELLSSSAATESLLPIAIVGIVFHYIYFFYPLGALVGGESVMTWLATARTVTVKHRALPLYVLVPSTAIMLIPSALLLLPSVDGSIPAFSIASEVAAQLLWVVSIYLTLGYGLASLVGEGATLAIPPSSEPQPRSAHQIRQILLGALRMRVAILLFWIAVFLWLGNTSLMMRTPPPVQVAVEKIAVQDHSLAVTVTLTDEKGSFRGFQPLHYYVAGANRELQSGMTERVLFPDGSDASLSLSRQAPRTTVTLYFSTRRGGKDLAQLEDLYLWYRAVRIIHLPMQQAVVTEPTAQQAPAPDAVNPEELTR